MTITDHSPEVGAAEADATPTLLAVDIVKGKATIDVDVSKLPDDIYQTVLALGLKELLNKGPGSTKITKAAYPKEAELKAKAMEHAAERLAALYRGELKAKSKNAGKVDRKVQTEAIRIAKELAKDLIERAGKVKWARLSAATRTEAAKLLLERDPSLYEVAKTNLEQRAKLPVAGDIDISSMVQEDPKLVAKAEKAEAERKTKGGTISAKQAGMTAKHKPGKGASVSAH